MKRAKLRNTIYYHIKKAFPRRAQILLRQQMALRTRRHCGDRWPIDPASAQKPAPWPGWPEGKQFALVLTHDVDTARGQERCSEVMALERERGFRSSFNFVAERYAVSEALRNRLVEDGFEVGLHGLYHDGKLYQSWHTFQRRAVRLNQYLQQWQAVGFRSPAMHHNLEWMHSLAVEYDASTFDTDPFEPQPDGMGTIFPFWVSGRPPQPGYVELPYTLPQDFTLFVILKESDISIWKTKLAWIAEQGGMALLITHPDYMSFSGQVRIDEYSADRYEALLSFLTHEYRDQYWNALPKTVATFWRERVVQTRATLPAGASRTDECVA